MARRSRRNSYYGWEYRPAPKAKAGSYRRKYGTSWWGKEFLQALKSMDHSARLGRGQTYANKGLVENLDIKGDGRISATVQGSYPTPYQISINWQAFTADEQNEIMELLTGNPALLGRLLAGELPDRLAADLSERGIHLFPQDWETLHASCSCPDWATPCKHEAAVFYVLAGEIDTDPFRIFSLRGFDLAAALHESFAGLAEEQQSEIVALETLLQSLDDLEVKAWRDDLVGQLNFSAIPELADRLISLLPAKPAFDSASDFQQYLKKIYSSTARYAKKILKREPLPIAEEILRSCEQADLRIDAHLSLTTLLLFDGADEEILALEAPESILYWLDDLTYADSSLLCDDLRALQIQFQLARQLAIQGAIIPQLLATDTAYLLRYLPAVSEASVGEMTGLTYALTPGGLLYLETEEGLSEFVPTAAGQAVTSVLLGTFIRLAVGEVWEDVPARRLFSLIGTETFDLLGTEKFPASIQRWLNRLYLAEERLYPIFQVTETEQELEVDILVVDREDTEQRAPVRLAEHLEEGSTSPDDFALLRNLSQLAQHFPDMDDYLAESGKNPLQFSVAEFTPILQRVLPIMEAFGLRVLLPKALKKLLRPSLGLQVSSSGKELFELSGLISLDGMLQFNWQTALGDQPIDAEAFRELLEHRSGLVKLKEGYAYLDEKEIAKLIEKLDSGEPALSVTQRMEALFAESYEGGPVRFDPAVRKLLNEWRNGPPPALPQQLQATLRPYQLRGYEWLYSNARFGFGSIIADDMGLGKTLQVITTLLKFKEEGRLDKEKALIVVPTSLLGNWQREIAKFAPALQTAIYHGSKRELPDFEEVDLLFTTYGLARMDEKKLAKLPWYVLVIDESQNIKNPAAQQTKSLKKYKTPLRIAMSGTPVENRLLDFWSVLDFVLPKYLGSQKYFKDKYGRPIQGERDQGVADRFRALTSPFVLRRLKTDKSIISDLPDKVVQDEHCDLTPGQVALYKSVVDTNLELVNKAESGIGRQGLILKLMTALKQVCNHPAQFLKSGPLTSQESGKAQLFRDRLEGILAAGDKVLVFTQYREMGEILRTMIAQEFAIEAPFLHGGCSTKQRDEMVERFQTDRRCPILLLSIKAGGTGLNLTAANHVIHYDLWWNPAVEAQATDRAYRIGQERTVFVHRLITKNSFEEKIDELIKSKQELADMSVGTGESWIGKLSNLELAKLVKL